jgi:hypothetical protein
MMYVFFGLPIVILFIMMAIHASESLEKMKLHWNEYRCNPIYMPFAGSIRPDVTTQENFLFCINQFGHEIFKVSLDGVHALLGTVTSSLGEFMKPLSSFRGMFSMIRNVILKFTASTFSKIASSSSVFIHYLIKIQDVLRRFVGQGYIAGYLTYVLVSFMEAFVKLFITIVKTFVTVMLAISFVLALFQPELLAITLALASILAAAGA